MVTPIPSNSVLDETALSIKIAEMASQLAKRVQDPSNCALIGIRTRGVTLARRLQEELQRQKGWELPLGVLDITLYRDDLSQLAEHPLVQSTEIEFDVGGKLIFLIDDVLYTGRTIRSALDALLEFGRPQRIMLGVLIDRGLREFPIQADVAALTLDTAREETVRVCFEEDDGRDCVVVEQRPAA
jgi:pyrimidine operon attenuation protein/uracil phosphoribosyltransferase